MVEPVTKDEAMALLMGEDAYRQLVLTTAVVDAAVAMVTGATVHPREWSSRHDLAIATAVRRLCPDLKPGWVGDPRYDGWDDPTDPEAATR